MNPAEVVENIRKRVPFKLASDDLDEDSNQILDEQEQEDVIQRLRQKNAVSTKENARLATIVIGLSVILHTMYLLGSGTGTPLSPIFPSATPEDPLPLATVFTLLHLFLHVNLIQRFIPPRTSIKYWLRANSFDRLSEFIPMPFSWAFAAAGMAPAFSLLSGYSLPTTLWWSTTNLVALLCYNFERWSTEGVADIRELEGMMYTAPGA